jgi:hypothetical protein
VAIEINRCNTSEEKRGIRDILVKNEDGAD